MSRRDGYQPQWDIDNSYGQEGELLVGDIIEGIKHGRVEVKRDWMFHKTGNLYVEYECYRQGGWHKSGVAITEAETWVFVLGDSNVAICISTDRLKTIARQCYRQARFRREEKDGSHPTKGVLVPATFIVNDAQTSPYAEADW